MRLLDIILGFFLVLGLYKGLKNGLFVELATFISFFIGIFVAIKFSFLIVDFFPNSWSPKTIKVVSFVITLLLIIVAIHQLAKVFSGIASFAYLGWLNKLGGAVFAVLKTILFLGILLSLIQKINFNNALISKEKQNDSLFFNPILKTADVLMPILNDLFTDFKTKITTDIK